MGVNGCEGNTRMSRRVEHQGIRMDPKGQRMKTKGRYEGSNTKGDLVLRNFPSIFPSFSFVLDYLNFPSHWPFIFLRFYSLPFEFLRFHSSPFIWPFISTKGRFLAHGGRIHPNKLFGRIRGFQKATCPNTPPSI